jgi:predicted PurR-regulated permease PerM
MTTLLGLVVLWQFRVVLIYCLLSGTLAATLRPLVTRLIGKSVWERVGWILVYMVAVVVAGYFLLLVGRLALMEIQQLATALSTQEQWTIPAWLKGSMLDQVLFERLLPPSRLFEIATYGQAGAALPAILGFTQSLASIVSGAFIIIGLSFYWVLSKSHFERLWLSILPSGQRKQARISADYRARSGTFIRSQLAINLLQVYYWELAIG